jgi:hypothetical protein
MAGKYVIAGTTLLLGLIIAGCVTPAQVTERPRSEPTEEKGRAWLGYLMHRARVYRLDDLFDPQYRADSKDHFVRQFQPDETYADWAGL